MGRTTAEKYDRASVRYDRMEGIIENLFFRRFRHLAVSLAGGKVLERSEERRVGKECRSRWSPYH